MTALPPLLTPLRSALYNFSEAQVRAALDAIVASDAAIRFSHPLGDSVGPQGYWDTVLAPLAAAWPDLERRDYIVMAGRTAEGADWIGCGGYYCGTFVNPWLDIPPTGHIAHMRFHEFYRIEEGRVTEVQSLWDIPEVMIQAGAWPMAPSLGREWHVPGPATHDGLRLTDGDPEAGRASADLVVEMLGYLKKHPTYGGPEVMEMERFWHPKMSWYGPAGIGTGRGIKGFRDWHQIPFLEGMPDRGRYVDEIVYHFFGDGPYVGVTGWPNMIQTITQGGWLGIPPVDKRVTMRSLDFWRIEDGLIRENWVLVDLLDMYDQIGVDPLARMREFNKARVGFDPDTGRAA